MELSVKDVCSFFARSPRLVYNIVQVGEAQLDEAVANNSDQVRCRSYLLIHVLVVISWQSARVVSALS